MIYELTYGDRIYTGFLGNEYQIGFDIFIPSNTVAFCDNLVITKDSANKELAHKFIDFMCTYKDSIDDTITPAYSNAYYVCYNTPFKTIYDSLVELKSYSFGISDENLFESELSNGINEYDSSLYGTIYDVVIGIAFDKYYHKDDAKGNKLTNFDRKYINKINVTFNNARA
jgi:spermidine/putrescine-binding protein